MPSYIDLHDFTDQEKNNSGLMYLFYVNDASVYYISYPVMKKA